MDQSTPENKPKHKDLANAVRFLSIDAVEKAQSGHPGMPMGMADVATVLFRNHLKYCAEHPEWPDRDRFILSAGHGSMLLYSLLYLTGYKKMSLDELKNFRQLDSLTAGHPEVEQDAGIETTTGPLGQGISNAVGFALAERILNARFGDEIVDHFTYVIASDGDLMEGISHESCSFAGHLGLNRLIVFYDDNGITIDGKTDLSFTDDTRKRFESYGWNVLTIDGHNVEEIEKATQDAKTSDKPSLICCKTVIGFGAPTKAGTAESHGAALGEEEIAETRKNLDWSYAPFEVPELILESWRETGRKNNQAFENWKARLQNASAEIQNSFENCLHTNFQEDLKAGIHELKTSFVSTGDKLATRKSSGIVLEKLTSSLPFLIGGSADLTGSNNTKTRCAQIINRQNYSGQYIHYGVREHGMAAIMNGMALHGGIIPFGGTFLTFSDYCRPSIRLAALMNLGSIFVFTHDSIGLGEDGPTHQPVEHLAALRAIPGLLVLRPCDNSETAEAWEIAISERNRPSAIILTRHSLPQSRTHAVSVDRNLSRKGGYILKEASNSSDPAVVIMATGSEVPIALEAQESLEAENISTRVVSIPCFELFREEEESYRNAVLGSGKSIRIAVEAGIKQGWHEFLDASSLFIGMESFGKSAPYQDLYKAFGITSEEIVKKVKYKISEKSN